MNFLSKFLRLWLWLLPLAATAAEVKPGNFFYYQELTLPEAPERTAPEPGAIPGFRLDAEIWNRIDNPESGLRIFDLNDRELKFAIVPTANTAEYRPSAVRIGKFNNPDGRFAEIEIPADRQPVTAVRLTGLAGDSAVYPVWLYGGRRRPDGSMHFVRVPLKNYTVSEAADRVELAQLPDVDMMRFDSFKLVLKADGNPELRSASAILDCAVFNVLIPDLPEKSRVYYGGGAPAPNYGEVIPDGVTPEILAARLGGETVNRKFSLPYRPDSYFWLFALLAASGGGYFVWCVGRSMTKKPELNK